VVLSKHAPLVEKLVWIYVYAGMILLGLGLAVQRNDTAIGWTMAGIGIASICVGIVLVYVRSRMKRE
jgi:formate hydrogenlyase subunit 3/multisubunit Na+/H+ antiporter MnhD subunit